MDAQDGCNFPRGNVLCAVIPRLRRSRVGQGVGEVVVQCNDGMQATVLGEQALNARGSGRLMLGGVREDLEE